MTRSVEREGVSWAPESKKVNRLQKNTRIVGYQGLFEVCGRQSNVRQDHMAVCFSLPTFSCSGEGDTGFIWG